MIVLRYFLWEIKNRLFCQILYNKEKYMLNPFLRHFLTVLVMVSLDDHFVDFMAEVILAKTTAKFDSE